MYALLVSGCLRTGDAIVFTPWLLMGMLLNGLPALMPEPGFDLAYQVSARAIIKELM